WAAPEVLDYVKCNVRHPMSKADITKFAALIVHGDIFLKSGADIDFWLRFNLSLGAAHDISELVKAFYKPSPPLLSPSPPLRSSSEIYSDEEEVFEVQTAKL